MSAKEPRSIVTERAASQADRLMVNPVPAVESPLVPRSAPEPAPALEGWLPKEVVLECAPVLLPAPDATTAAERAHVAGAVLKRQREFLSGRLAARRGLARLGVPAAEVPVGAGRAPVWPPEVVGSIAHSAEWCLAVVALRRHLEGIGVDLEPDLGLEPELWRKICTEDELAAIGRRPLAEQGRWVRRHFSAKEAIYKCQYPSSGLFLGFQDVEVAWSQDEQLFSARLRPEAGHARLLKQFADGRGSWRLVANSLFFCWIFPASG
jgi:4'-phosphopantetheinyl transferase EntD